MDTASDRVALLVIRVWLEGDSAGRDMRARLTATSDIADRDAPETVSLASDVDAVCDHVRSWLMALLDAGDRRQ